MKTLGAGIIGTGWVSEEYIKAFQKNLHCEVVALCSRDAARAKAKAAEHRLQNCAAFADPGDMLKAPGLDIVVVCTPHHLHVEQGVAAARAGKHAIVEKPIAISVPSLRQDGRRPGRGDPLREKLFRFRQRRRRRARLPRAEPRRRSA